MTRQAVVTRDGQGCDGDTQGATGTLRRHLIHLQGWEGFQEERTARLGQLGEEWEWGHVLGGGNSVDKPWEV